MRLLVPDGRPDVVGLSRIGETTEAFTKLHEDLVEACIDLDSLGTTSHLHS